MLELAKVNEVVAKAASGVLNKQAGISRVESEPTVDSDGQEALHITIVLKGDSVDRITGDDALNTLVSIDRALRAAKEERFPILNYVTEAELAAEELGSGDDAES